MEMIIGSDHAGFELKEDCRTYLKGLQTLGVQDAGVFGKESADYPRVAHAVARAVSSGQYPRGLLICGTGLGMSMAANRYPGIRAALCHNIYTARMCRRHNDANILVMGGRVIGVGLALEMLEAFLNTSFEGERHQRRLDQFGEKWAADQGRVL